MGSRPRRVLFTGHANGAVQIWDMTTALDLPKANDSLLASSNKKSSSLAHSSSARFSALELNNYHSGGPTPQELVRALEQCEVIYYNLLKFIINLLMRYYFL